MTRTPPAPRARRPHPFWFLTVGLMILLSVIAVPQASAAGTATVDVTRAVVTGQGADARVEVTGSITNDSTQPLYDVRVDLWRSTQVLRSRPAVEAALTATQTPQGRSTPLAPENSATVVEQGDQLAPGARREVTVSGKLADFGITATDASYWVGLSVRGSDADGGRTSEIGSARSLITLPGETPVPVTTVIDVSAPPHQVKANLFLDDTLTTDLDERVAPLLAEAKAATWLVDPALLTELTDMADGYRVQSDDGSVEGENAAAAATWLDRLNALPDAQVWSPLFAEPDLTDPGVLPAALATEEGVQARTDRRLITLDAPTDAMLTPLVDLDRPVLATGLDSGGLPFVTNGVVVIPALRASDLTLGSALPATAQNVGAALTALARVDGGQVRLVRSADDLSDGAGTPPWLVDTRLSGLVDAPTPQGTLSASPDAVRPLVGETASRVRGLVVGVTTYAEAAPDAGLDGLPNAVWARAASRWWVPDPQGQTAWLDAVDARVGMDTLLAGISLDATARFSLAGGTSSFPVTVTNTLLDPVTVTLLTTEDNPQRIKLVAPKSITIAPGSSQTVPVTAEVHGGGVIRASIHVVTLEGRRLTPDASITVQTTSYGLVGWTLVIVSGIVLVVSTALRIRQVRRQQKGGANG